MDAPFWQEKQLKEMDSSEWESLCDGCARCCLYKLEDEGTADVFYTSIVCCYLEEESCLCTDYANRNVNVPNCVQLNIENIDKFRWLPDTCAYRLLSEKKDLAWWHPLIAGEREAIREAGITITGKVIDERYVHPEGHDEYIIHWVSQ